MKTVNEMKEMRRERRKYVPLHSTGIEKTRRRRKREGLRSSIEILSLRGKDLLMKGIKL